MLGVGHVGAWDGSIPTHLFFSEIPRRKGQCLDFTRHTLDMNVYICMYDTLYFRVIR